MFTVTNSDIRTILTDFNVNSKLKSYAELQRYDYEKGNPDSKEVRLIVKAEFESTPPVVVRLKNEADVTLEIIESQSRFAEALMNNGIATPRQYKSNGNFARWYTINGYDVSVTVEQFVEGEIKIVTEEIAEKTGRLLAETHNIAEKHSLHVKNEVLFDPFGRNDLFGCDDFLESESAIPEEEKPLYCKIKDKYNEYMTILSPLKFEPRHAVQGDISDCNMYLTAEGKVGIYDFNRCGDNNLFCDAVMQADFEARLMDYENESGGKNQSVRPKILAAFYKGYRSTRDFTPDELTYIPYLRAIIDAFWLTNIRWDDNSLVNAVKNGDKEKIREHLERIWDKLTKLYEVPV